MKVGAHSAQAKGGREQEPMTSMGAFSVLFNTKCKVCATWQASLKATERQELSYGKKNSMQT